MNFKVDALRLTLDDLIAMESGKISAVRDVMAKCLVDDGGQPVPVEDALKIIGGTPLAEFKSLSERFKVALEAFTALPPSGGKP